MKSFIPTATYRFQFNKEFTFRAARDLAGYLHDLGITHIYASPFFRAAPGSMHGYDVCDHNELNPEIGTREDFDALAAEMKARDMRLIVDFVPNHMGIGEPQNGWWMDVLENGPSSPYARFFDIDWQPLKRELENKVLLPILGDQYGRVLERGELRIEFSDGAFALNYCENRLPLGPRTVRPILQRAADLLEPAPPELVSIITALDYLPPAPETSPEKIAERAREKQIIRERLVRLCSETGSVEDAIMQAMADWQDGSDPANLDRLDELVSAQSYRLAYWRVAAEEINYRRFFDINTLAAICMELPEVFEATHQLLLELIATGIVDGVRIDHIDGLAFPEGYLAALQSRAAGVLESGDPSNAIYLLVEKILGHGERLRTDWPCHGTTGYEVGAQICRVLTDPRAEAAMSECYHKFIGRVISYRDLVYRTKSLVMRVSMSSEVNALAHLLNRLSECHRWYRDFTINSLTTAIREIIACFPVYRTYIVPDQPVQESDAKVIKYAISQARRRNPAIERTIFDFLRDVLMPPDPNPHPVDEDLRRSFVLKFQQCTGPITAKGVEDTSFYVYNRLVSLNEVGGEPDIFGSTVEDFHKEDVERLKNFPHCMTATSTHDTKRAEDTRARIAALSELAGEWAKAVRHWRTLNRKHKHLVDGASAPDANEEYLIYQTLIGSWPLEEMNASQRAVYIRRIQDYMMKALHEAKENSSWIEPNEDWDRSVREFIAKMLHLRATNRFVASFAPLASRAAELGAQNSLSQIALKLTIPGVPDIYQGSELWDLSLVDPDNRRPVDYARRQEILAALKRGEVSSPGELLEHWRDGRIKMFVIHTLLKLRQANRALFDGGSYAGLTTHGTHARSCVAFLRENNGRRLLVVVPRLSGAVGFPAIGDRWSDTAVETTAPDAAWRDVFTGAEHPAGEKLRLAGILAEFPLAVLESH